MKKPEVQPSIFSRSRLVKTAGLFAAAALLPACAGTEEAADRPAMQTTTTVERKRMSAEEMTANNLEKIQGDQRKDAEMYLAGEGRNTKINDSVQTNGTQIIQAAEAGQLGDLSFFNPATQQTGRTDNEGWGELQVQTNGSPNQLFVTVYQAADGAIDLSQGVQGLRLNVEGQPIITFQSPQYDSLLFDEPVRSGWEVTVTPKAANGELGDTVTTASQNTVIDQYELKDIDIQAMNALTALSATGFQG